MSTRQFKEQIREDLRFLNEEHGGKDSHLAKPEYAFNYWVLGKLYNVEEEVIPDLVVEYSDKGIDCYCHFAESRELFLIQNKFYDENTALSRKELSDFLQSPLSQLKNDSYAKSPELQDLFNGAIGNPDYKIWLDFYLTNDKRSADAETLVKQFNLQEGNRTGAQIRARINYLKDIENLYYGRNYRDGVTFEYTLHSPRKGTVLQVLPEYGLSGLTEAYYVMCPVAELYDMYRKARDKDYPLFEENIREYLGAKGTINNGIIRTLRDPEDRKNFFFYNNGITLICSAAKDRGTIGNRYAITFVRPQVVNGCQTTNTIFEVLDDYSQENRDKEFQDVWIMVKVLVFDDRLRKARPSFYQDIVKYTNRQNAISESAWGASHELFENLQKHLRERGFLLHVKPSDKESFNQEYGSRSALGPMLARARDYIGNSGVSLSSIRDISIPLDRLIQLYLAACVDPLHPFESKSFLLRPTSRVYLEHSLNIHKHISTDSMIRLFLLHRRAEIDRKNSDDGRTPIPYYLIGFLGATVREDVGLDKVLEELFTGPAERFSQTYSFFESLTSFYKDQLGTDYNKMIKRAINWDLLGEKNDQLIKLVQRDKPAFMEFRKTFLAERPKAHIKQLAPTA